MMRVASLVVALALPLLVHAQRLSHPVMVSRDDAFSSPAAPLAGPDTVRVLALMVQFKTDTDERTTGNGQFDLTSTASPALDSPPHDAAYFRNHLLFLQNYYGTSSKGKVIVQSTLIDQVVTLSSQMGVYSPVKGASNLPVANLAVDSWRAADSLHLVPDFSVYNAFVVLHAGVGRDIDLVSQLGYDPTPLDIPSLYFGMSAFKGFYGQDYQGIPVNGGAFHITNSIVVPETETRTLATAAGDATIDFSINGLLCASLGNYLGLPDLFNTATGASGIGRFGLMDGQAIFSYNGAFPPEPSAWEKYFLGWITPIVVPPGTTNLSLPAVAIADTIYRVPINATEYFLVENRNRDPLRTGLTVTSVYNGVTKQQTFTRDTVGLDGYLSDFSALSGVITSVSSYDWSLPGGAAGDTAFYDGGVLIWHIDEDVIARTIAMDSVNAGARKGVNLKEADGSQDIGQSYGLLDPGAGSEAGWFFDYWYQGNSAPVYKNEFSATTFPNSNSNLGTNSHVTIRAFSARGPRMTAVVNLGDSAVTLLPGFPKSLGQKLPPQALAVKPSPDPVLFVATRDSTVRDGHSVESIPAVLSGKLYAWTQSGSAALPGGSSSGVVAFAQLYENFHQGLAVGDLDNDGIASESVLPQQQAGGGPGPLQAFSLRNAAPADSLADLLFTTVPRSISTTPVIADSQIALGEASGKVSFVSLSGSSIDTTGAPVGGSAVVGISLFAGKDRFVVTHRNGTVELVGHSATGGWFMVEGASTRDFGRQIVGPAATGEFHGTMAIAFTTADGYLYLVDGALNTLPGFPVKTGGAIVAPPALADVDGDGNRDIVVLSGSNICAYNYLGASLDHFPVEVMAGQPLTSSPIVADMDGDGAPDIVGVTGDGVVAAVNRNGKNVRGFPLAAGVGRQSVASFIVSSRTLGVPDRVGLVVASSDDGTVSAWTTGPTGLSWSNPWPQYQKDARHSGFDGTTLTPVSPAASQEFFPASRAYNWPNPVYDGITHIRYYIKESATVQIKIFDLAGDLVTSMQGPGVGGMDNEVEWKVGSVQSGIYFARIEASGAGASGVNIVKVAIVK